MSWPGMPACPCGCGAEGLKLQLRYDRHLVGCRCRACTGRRNRRKGRGAERRRHVRLGGQGPAPADELPAIYELRVTTEDKCGDQIPASFRTFVGSEWARRALRQAELKLPAGTDALPALYLEAAGSWWLVVKGAHRAQRPRGVHQ